MPRPVTESTKEKYRARLLEQAAKEAIPDSLFRPQFDLANMGAEMREVIARSAPKLMKEFLRGLHRGNRAGNIKAMQMTGELLGLLRSAGFNVNFNQQINNGDAVLVNPYRSRFDDIVNRLEADRAQRALPAPAEAIETAHEQPVLEAVPVEPEA